MEFMQPAAALACKAALEKTAKHGGANSDAKPAFTLRKSTMTVAEKKEQVRAVAAIVKFASHSLSRLFGECQSAFALSD